MKAKEFIKYAAIFATGAYTQHKYTQNQVFRDPGFLELFDVALQKATKEDIDQLIYLEPDQLRDWVMAPELFRPKLLEKFATLKQQITFKTQQAAEDDELIKADDRRKIKRLIIFLPLALFGVMVGIGIWDDYGVRLYLSTFIILASLSTALGALISNLVNKENVREARNRRMDRLFSDAANIFFDGKK
jgi:hypothetical protein